MKENDFIISLLIVTFIVSLFILIPEEKVKREYCESCIIYDKNVKFGLSGVFHRPDYYCVWTKGRNDTSIDETATHELCHVYVDDSYGHFCIDYKK